MQYKIGTVSITAGTNVVTGTGTAFLANVKVGDSFKVYGENVIYQVAAVDSDTQLKLSPNYAGGDRYAVRYQVMRDRTPNLGLAEINAGDEDWPYWLTNEVIRKLDTTSAGGGTGEPGPPGEPGTTLLSGLTDLHIGPTAPTDPTKLYWIKTPA